MQNSEFECYRWWSLHIPPILKQALMYGLSIEYNFEYLFLNNSFKTVTACKVTESE